MNFRTQADARTWFEKHRAHVRRVLNRYLFPRSCAVCSRLIDESEPPRLGDGICGHCLALLPFRDMCQPVFPVLRETGQTISELDSSQHLLLATAVCHCLPPVPTLMARLKFHDALYLANPLGELMAYAAHRAFPEYDPQLIVSVPLHPTREKERGYNQALELANVMSRVLGIPHEVDAAYRIRNTARQTELDDESARQFNLKGAFAVSPEQVRAKRILLIDDVLTSGATIFTLARQLTKYGAIDVRAVVFASGR